MGGAMLSKSLIQFSVVGWSCVPPLLFTWGQTMVEVMRIIMPTLKRSHAGTAMVRAPNPLAGHHWAMPPLEAPGHPQSSLLWSHCTFLLGPGARGSVVPSKSLFPSPMQVLAIPWWGHWWPRPRGLMPYSHPEHCPCADHCQPMRVGL